MIQSKNLQGTNIFINEFQTDFAINRLKSLSNLLKNGKTQQIQKYFANDPITSYQIPNQIVRIQISQALNLLKAKNKEKLINILGSYKDKSVTIGESKTGSPLNYYQEQIISKDEDQIRKYLSLSYFASGNMN